MAALRVCAWRDKDAVTLAIAKAERVVSATGDVTCRPWSVMTMAARVTAAGARCLPALREQQSLPYLLTFGTAKTKPHF